ncbi:MAG: hypothetical protein J6L81_04205 [Clostridia bacterium]|nr:hypothetical protein [Clostridia bacterium]
MEQNTAIIQAPQQKPKKNFRGLKITLIVIFSIIGTFALTFGILAAIYYIEAAQPVCWKSGEVIIGGTPITIPCDIDEFEDTFDIDIAYSGNLDYSIEDVIVSTDDGEIGFEVYITGEKVSGIMTGFYPSENADKIVFPGDITLDSDIEDVTENYTTKPFNIYFNGWSEDIVQTDSISTGYRYVDWESYEMSVKTLDGEITEISYFYIADEF